MTDDTKLPLTSENPTESLLAQLREQAPHLFSEGKVDWDKLKATLGESIETRAERYGLTWAGKADAFRAVQTPSVGTLLPMPEESVNFDSSENLIIEGDNLEVLKLLQKSYHGQVKMIYIDPPYNTGNEFIYPDNYREGLDDYLRYSGQVSEAGLKQSTNTESSGRFHSKWLNMMYPRLFMARNLLRDDGVIFVSIDDNEVHNLRMLMNEVFGEENFLASFVRKRRMPTGMTDTQVSADHEYVIAFARVVERVKLIGRLLTEGDYPFKDQLSHYRSTDLTVGMTRDMRPNQYYGITNKNTGRTYFPPEQRVWRFEPNSMNREILKGNIIWPEDMPDSRMSRPRYKTRYDPKKTSPISTWIEAKGTETTEDSRRLMAGMNQEGTRELRELLGSQALEYPKPVSLVRGLTAIATTPSSGDIVLDFFAGSGTTAHSVIDLNQDDSGNRKFILVQLPEKTDNPQYPTIADITRERVRRVIAKLNEADAGKLDLEDKTRRDRGFRAFKLSSSNFKIWDTNHAATEPEQLAAQLHLYTDNLAESRTRQDVLYELILKSGLPLTAKVEAQTVAGKTVHSIAEGNLLICLGNPVTQELLRGMMALEPLQILCLDTAFHGNDPLKTNAVLEARSHGITFRTV
jgi:adenine-specific DNA-methyltransferase